MAVNSIPEKVIGFNVYNEGERLVGIAGEVTLPNLEAMTETLSGAGIAGEFESAVPGHYGSMEIEMTFRTIIDKTFSLQTPKAQTLILRASQQHSDYSAGETTPRGLRIILKVMPKGVDLGTLSNNKPTDSKIKLEVLYIKIIENEKTIFELDKLNYICVMNGEDVLSNIRNQI